MSAFVLGVVNHRAAFGNFAATCIQRAYRNRPMQRKGRPTTRSIFRMVNADNDYRSVMQGEFHATMKYDGTNFGVDTDGVGHGRNHVVQAEKYQSSSTGAATNANIKGVRTEIFKQLPDTCQDKEPYMVIFGELMLAGGGASKKYNYKNRGLVETWHPFGCVMLFEEKEDHQTVLQELLSSGFNAYDRGVTTTEPVRHRIGMLMSDKFRVALQNCDLTPVTELARGTLVDTIQKVEPALLGAEEEGIVLVSPTNPGTKMKLKNGNEMQVKDLEQNLLNGIQATKTFSMLYTGPFDTLPLVLDACLRIATTRTIQPPAKKTKGEKVTKTMSEEEKAQQAAKTKQAAYLVQCWESALTKFDSPAVYFEKDDSPQGFLAMMLKEVMDDAKPQNEEEEAAVTQYVKQQTGKLFGPWKAQKKKAK
eukprot:TRINITY_DN67834_c7_g2_i1.p1 TRINITY_DN67834_c7_g2~~TRINITY_DN67834_c7_g2_i1.p1  ORF type:complete len:448 (-),score=59.38 TRINITY_DN67834_c7_g2_i1:452-1711(-)